VTNIGFLNSDSIGLEEAERLVAAGRGDEVMALGFIYYSPGTTATAASVVSY